MPTVICKYKCACTRDDPDGGWRSIEIGQRRPDEDAVDWMKRAQTAISLDHVGHAPMCKSPKCDLMIPFGGGRVGERSYDPKQRH